MRKIIENESQFVITGTFISKKYIEFEDDDEYSIKYPYEEKLYNKTSNKEWEFVKDQIIGTPISISNNQEDYKLILEKIADINQDGKMDKILVYGTEFKEKIEPTDLKKYLIVINLTNSNTTKNLTNNKIIEPYYPENGAVGFSDIKVKNNYFTIEQTNAGNGIIVRSYTTFKYNKQKNEIYLYKYSTIFTSLATA